MKNLTIREQIPFIKHNSSTYTSSDCSEPSFQIKTPAGNYERRQSRFSTIPTVIEMFTRQVMPWMSNSNS